MEKDELKQIIKSSLIKVYDKDEILFRIGVDERCISHRFAFYLSEYIEDETIKVDVEYNRHLVEMKYYEDNKYGSLDILIHERGTDVNNICAFECKKEKISAGDLRKISALLGDEYRYSFGATVECNAKRFSIYSKQDGLINEETIII